MSLKALHDGLVAVSEKNRTLSSADVCDRFVELLLDPRCANAKIPEEVSDLLRRSLLDNDPVNRVYETVDAVLSLGSDASLAEEILESDFRRFCDHEAADDEERVRLLKNGEALKACVRTSLYMKKYGMIADFAAFFAETEDEFRSTGTVAHPSRYVFMAKILFVNLLVSGQKEDLFDRLFVPVSMYRLRSAETGKAG